MVVESRSYVNSGVIKAFVCWSIRIQQITVSEIVVFVNPSLLTEQLTGLTSFFHFTGLETWPVFFWILVHLYLIYHVCRTVYRPTEFIFRGLCDQSAEQLFELSCSLVFYRNGPPGFSAVNSGEGRDWTIGQDVTQNYSKAYIIVRAPYGFRLRFVWSEVFHSIDVYGNVGNDVLLILN